MNGVQVWFLLATEPWIGAPGPPTSPTSSLTGGFPYLATIADRGSEAVLAWWAVGRDGQRLPRRGSSSAQEQRRNSVCRSCATSRLESSTFRRNVPPQPEGW